ncbi:MAG: tRNA threonylcarbamoyladenosine dehydratase [Oscillospiraceae bacterium]|jgi:tRNA A37 threonylcarbamoyladenosine dehydratase|nr:tRNA threonylcarbamoyladenosine dehydratase [Oscillospiraceae bacterium]
MSEMFLRNEMLLGFPAMERLKNAHVAVFGLGGVGSWCAEALCRAGVGRLTLIDSDVVSLSNLNRQLEALHSTLEAPKAAALRERLLDINPAADITALPARYEASSREAFFAARYDYIADCIDLVAHKLDLIETALSRGVPIISALGTGNKTDLTRLEITDISKTKNCPLARVMRKELRRREIKRLTVVYSPEEALEPEQREAPPPGRRSVPGSLVWVPASAGLLMCQKIVLDIADGNG